MKAILHSKTFYYVLILLLVMVVPHLAFAQAAGGGAGAVGFPFSVDNNDLSKKYVIDYLFGPISPGAPAGGPNPLGSLLGTFSAICLAIGGVMVAYTLFAGTLVTAHEGEILGKKWSSLWLPLRITLGSAILLPIKAFGGFCVLQAVVIWLAVQGVGAANTIWTAYLQSNPMESTGVFSAANGSAYALASNIAYSSLCLAASKSKYDSIWNSSDPNEAASKNIMPKVSDPGAAFSITTYPASTVPGSTSPPALLFGDSAHFCGGLTLPDISTAPTPVVLTGVPSTQETFVQNISTIAGTTTRSIRVSTYNDTISMANDIYAQAQNVMSYYSVGNVATSNPSYLAAVQKLQKTVQDWSNKFQQDQEKAGEDAYKITVGGLKPYSYLEQNGWLMAGAYYMFFVDLENSISTAVADFPSYQSPILAPNESLTNNDCFSLGSGSFRIHIVGPGCSSDITSYNAYGKQIASGIAGPAGLLTKLNNPVQNQHINSQSGGNDNTYTKDIIAAFNDSKISNQMQAQYGSAGITNPIIMMANIGHIMIDASWFFLLAGGAISFFSSALGNLGLMIFGSLVVPGGTLGYFLPMLPFILWMGAFFGWVVLLVEAVVAAPLWALAHLFPDGDGIVGRAGQGYMLVLSLMLKPALMVIGLIISIIIMDPIGKVVNIIFLTAGSFLTNGVGEVSSTGALIGFVFGAIVYITLMYQLIRRIFDLIHIIPDTVLRWLGAPGGRELGENAQHAASSERGALAVMGGMKLAGDFAGGASSAIGAPGRRLAKSFAGRGAANAEARKSGVEGLRSNAAGKLASAEQAGAYSRMGSPADREKGANKMLEASMDQAVAQSATASGKGKNIGFNSTGVGALESVSAGLSQRQIAKGAGWAANRQHLAGNIAQIENAGGDSSRAKAALDKFDESSMDAIKQHVADNDGDAGGLTAAAASVYGASQHRDDANTAKMERLGGGPSGGGEVASNMQKANSAIENAVRADPSIATKAASMGGIHKFMGAVQNDPSLVNPVAKGYMDTASHSHSKAQSLADSFVSTAKSFGMSEADINASRPPVSLSEPPINPQGEFDV